MDIRQLRYFLAVAEAGHITCAAARLGMQQPPLSQQMHALEAELGRTLLSRHPKGVALTDAGRELQAQAQRIVAGMEALTQRMAHFAAGRRVPVDRPAGLHFETLLTEPAGCCRSTTRWRGATGRRRPCRSKPCATRP
jgi:DNA-binding transcriptional LysR family regulator